MIILFLNFVLLSKKCLKCILKFYDHTAPHFIKVAEKIVKVIKAWGDT